MPCSSRSDAATQSRATFLLPALSQSPGMSRRPSASTPSTPSTPRAPCALSSWPSPGPHLLTPFRSQDWQPCHAWSSWQMRGLTAVVELATGNGSRPPSASDDLGPALAPLAPRDRPSRPIAEAARRTGRSECERQSRATGAARLTRLQRPLFRGSPERSRGAGEAPPGSRPNLHPEDYVGSINFNKRLDFVGFCDLSRTSPTGFRAQTLLTGFGLTCHARRVRAHWRESLASTGFVRITCSRSPPRHEATHTKPCVCARMVSLEVTSSLARSTSAPLLITNALPARSGEWVRRKTLTEDVRWLLRGSISKKADGGCTSSSSGRSSRSA